MKFKKGSVLVTLILVTAMLATFCMAGCSNQEAAETPAVTAPQTEAPSPAAVSQAPKTLKIGAVVWLGWPLGLDMTRAIQVMMDMDNAAGGLEIGGEKYQLELVTYDHNMNVATAEAAVNKLIFEDDVDFILADPVTIDAWLPITEENKVIALGPTLTNVILDPAKHYCFMAGFMNNQSIAVPQWFAKNYPDKKTVICAYPDDQRGHDSAGANEEVLASFGMQPTTIFYPANSQDLSSLGTKVKDENPDVFMAQGGGASDALALKAVWQAGYKGQLLANNESPLSSISQICPAEGLEGMICATNPSEFEPALTEYAKKFKAAWIEKFGAWEDPSYGYAALWSCLRAGLQKAGSLDTDAVADAIGSGLEYESVVGRAKMVSRPDLGNDRTVDSVVTAYVKQIVDGKVVLLDEIPLEEAEANFKAFYK